jgi:hypothetical protein
MYCYLLVFCYVKNKNTYSSNLTVNQIKPFSDTNVSHYEQVASYLNEGKSRIINIIPIAQETHQETQNNKRVLYNFIYKATYKADKPSLEIRSRILDHYVTDSSVDKDYKSLILFLLEEDPDLEYEVISHIKI